MKQALSSQPIVVAYNSYLPLKNRAREAASEKAIAVAARQAAAALKEAGWHKTALLPIADNLQEACRRLSRLKPLALVNLCEGFRGQPQLEAQMAGLWELLNFPYTGNRARALQLCQNKYQTKLLLSSIGVRVPKAWLATTENDIPQTVPWPLIVKPVAEDGGIGIYARSVVHDRSDLAAQIRRITRRYAQPALVEQYIEGREFNVAVIERPELAVLPVTEILFKNLKSGLPHLVGFQAKWQEQHFYYRKTVPQCPADLAPRLTAELQQAALRAWTIAGLRGYARFDVRLDQRGRFWFLEINPNPDTSRGAGLARALEAADIAYAGFWAAQIEVALRRAKGILC